MIVDCHCHAGTGDGFSAPWDTEARIEPHLERARAAGIDRTVVFPVFNSNYAAANARLARIVRAYPRELVGFASIHPARDAGRIRSMLGRAVEEYGFRGVKVHGLDALPTREACEAVRHYGIPMLVDVVGKVHVVDMLAQQYPDVPFIIPHLGTFADHWTAHLQVIDQLVRFPNVFADTSGVRYWQILVTAVRRAGPRKILFGSDGPLLHPALELYKIKLLRLRPADEALVTGGNILRLLGARGPCRGLTGRDDRPCECDLVQQPRARGARPRPRRHAVNSAGTPRAPTGPSLSGRMRRAARHGRDRVRAVV